MAEKYKAKYKCSYPNCMNEPIFERIIGRTGGGIENSHGHVPQVVSSQVKCPKCGNFLKTWQDAIDVQPLGAK